MANEDFKLGVGQAHEFEIAARPAGWTNADFTRLTQDEEKLRQVLAYVRGSAEFKAIAHMIDCDADPFIPDGLTVEEHRKGGLLDLAKTKIALYLTKGQKKGRVVGNDLRKELAGQPVLNANVLDYYLANQHLIPEEWKGKAVFFWGTIYRDRVGHLYVRFLYWSGVGWRWHHYWFGFDWRDDNPAAVRAS
jgi:hypothetical protein